MKILIIHYRFYRSSGPESYLFNIINLLTRSGHKIIPFSIDYSQNEKTEFSKYFVQPPFSKETFHIRDDNTKNVSPLKKIKFVKNMFFNSEAYTNLKSLIKHEKPDIAYVLQYGAKLSTSVFDACYKNNIPVVLRVSDFNLLCPKNIFYRNNSVCTKCLNNLFYSVYHKCIHDSYTKSFINFLTYEYNSLRNFMKMINAIVVPSKFTEQIFLHSRKFNQTKIKHIPTFIPNYKININFNYFKANKLCYFGRINYDKGIHILIDAIKIIHDQGLKVEVDIYGSLDNDYAQNQIKKCDDWQISNIIKFLGFKDNTYILDRLQEYSFSIIPSVWFDNMPNSFIESQSRGVPVIASAIGSLKELIKNSYNGFLFKPGNPDDLAKVILEAINRKDLLEIRRNCIKWVNQNLSENEHVNSLIKLFEKSIHDNRSS